MTLEFWYLLFTAAVTIAAFFLVRFLLSIIRREKKGKEDLEGEEQRMFGFLHLLGGVIEKGTSLESLYRVIVRGVSDVVQSQGAALYLLNDQKEYLVPKSISDGCPPIIGLPVEIIKRAERDPKAIPSYVRLTRVPVGEGLLGAGMLLTEVEHYEDLRAHPTSRDNLVRYKEQVEVMLAPLKIAGVDVGVLAVVNGDARMPFTKNDKDVFRSLSEQCAFAIRNAAVRKEALEMRHLENDLRNAQEVQRVLLPDKSPELSGYRIVGYNEPARIISGDYYDYVKLGSGELGVVIADVSGKGVAAGLLMAMCRSILRSFSSDVLSCKETLSVVNRHIFPDTREDMFISMAYLKLSEKHDKIQMSRAGHDAPLVYRAKTKTVEEMRPPGLAVGIDEGNVFNRVTEDIEFELESGDCLLLYTDGLTEAEDDTGEEFGVERVREIIMNSASLGAEVIVEDLRGNWSSFVGSQAFLDDLTLIAIEKR